MRSDTGWWPLMPGDDTFVGGVVGKATEGYRFTGTEERECHSGLRG